MLEKKFCVESLWARGFLYFFMAQQPPLGQGLLFVETSRSRSDIPQSVGLFWASDQPDPEIVPDNTLHSQETDIHAPGGIQTRNPSKRAAADRRFRPRGHWDRHYFGVLMKNSSKKCENFSIVWNSLNKLYLVQKDGSASKDVWPWCLLPFPPVTSTFFFPATSNRRWTTTRFLSIDPKVLFREVTNLSSSWPLTYLSPTSHLPLMPRLTYPRALVALFMCLFAKLSFIFTFNFLRNGCICGIQILNFDTLTDDFRGFPQ
jgi:hypothetical protein